MGVTTLSDVILSNIQMELSDVYTSLPATILDVSKLTSDNILTVQIATDIVDPDGRVYKLPPLADVPVKWPGGGGAVMTFPLAVGDDVLVVFSMHSISEFQASLSGTVQPFDARLHNISDCYVDPRIYRDQLQPSPNATDVEIKFNDAKIAIKPDGTIKSNNANSATTMNPDGSIITACVNFTVNASNDITLNAGGIITENGGVPQ